MSDVGECRYCRHGEHESCKQVGWKDSVCCSCDCTVASVARKWVRDPGLEGGWRSDPGTGTLAERVRYIADGPHPWIPGGPSGVALLKEIATALEAYERACICEPASVISDGPSVDCPIHGRKS